jgi:hypothetical protein
MEAATEDGEPIVPIENVHPDPVAEDGKKLRSGELLNVKKVMQKNKLSRHINSLYDGKHSHLILWQ